MSILVLFSGGLDSTVALYYARQQVGWEDVYAISFNYGQRHVKELGAVGKITDLVGIKGYQLLPIPGYFLPDKSSSLFGRNEVLKYDKIPDHEEASKDPAFIPHRNLLFLVIAAQYAQKYKCGTIYTGLRGGYPDCTAHFEMQVGDTLEMSDPDFPIHVWSPCHGSREETIGLAYSLPGCWDALAYSMTCFEGTEPPCGHCLPCLKRAEGFAKFGKPDPLLVRLAKEGRYHGPIA